MRSPLTHPARVVPAAFALAALAGTLLLSLPLATSTGQRAEVLDAAFTSVSAVCVTGLVTVDTATYWSPFGQVVILSLVQVGGFGIMTLATLLVVLVGARLNLSSSLVAQAETRALNVGDVRDVVRRVAVTMLAFEAVLAGLLTLRFRVGYDHDWSQALWHGVFHSVTAFNNAGFALYRDNLVGFAADAWILLPICAGVIIGGIGFPVLFELRRRCRQPRSWSVHVRLTVYGSALLLVLGAVSFLALEWSNPGTLGPISPAGKLLGSLTGSVMPRTAGFNTVDYAAVTPETLMVTSLLMFVGGGSAGTAGGIKVATFFLLAFVIWTEVRGERDTTIAHRRIGTSTMRQALTVALLGVAVVAIGTLVLLLATDLTTDVVGFEAISAFATVGLSTGITAGLPASAKLTLMGLMFVGRVGTITVASALALRTHHHHYRLPEERPIVG
jgi:trk system potassium uptake protein